MTKEYDTYMVQNDELSEAPQLPSFALDVERYRADLAEYDLTTEQETELLEALWHIMTTFVRMGFAGNICEQLPQKGYGASPAPGDSVDSNHSIAAETAKEKETSP